MNSILWKLLWFCRLKGDYDEVVKKNQELENRILQLVMWCFTKYLYLKIHLAHVTSKEILKAVLGLRSKLLKFSNFLKDDMSVVELAGEGCTIFCWRDMNVFLNYYYTLGVKDKGIEGGGWWGAWEVCNQGDGEIVSLYTENLFKVEQIKFGS